MKNNSKKVIKVKKDEETKELYIDLKDLDLDLDLNNVKFYSIDTKDGGVVISLFDKNKDIIVLRNF